MQKNPCALTLLGNKLP